MVPVPRILLDDGLAERKTLNKTGKSFSLMC